MHYAMRDVKDMGQQMGYRSLEWNWPKEATNTYLLGQELLMELSCFNLLSSWLTSIDEGCTHQGSWGRVGDVAGTAMRKTQVAVQSQGPGNTHREGTYLQLGSPAICVYVWLCACKCRQTAYYLIPTPSHRSTHSLI